MKPNLIKSNNFIIITLALLMISCIKEPTFTGTLHITTDKDIYQNDDSVYVIIKNLSDSVAVFNWSKLHYFIPVVYKYNNDSWFGYWAESGNTYCCKELAPGMNEKETLKIEFEKGIYRIVFYFTMRPGNKTNSYYSNIFCVE